MCTSAVSGKERSNRHPLLALIFPPLFDDRVQSQSESRDSKGRAVYPFHSVKRSRRSLSIQGSEPLSGYVFCMPAQADTQTKNGPLCTFLSTHRIHIPWPLILWDWRTSHSFTASSKTRCPIHQARERGGFFSPFSGPLSPLGTGDKRFCQKQLLQQEEKVFLTLLCHKTSSCHSIT